MLLKFSSVMQAFYHKRSKDYTDELTDEMSYVLALMREHRIDQYEPWTIKLFQDYIECNKYGIRYKSQRGKVVEALLKYGHGSLFWDELKRTEIQRNREWARVSFVASYITRYWGSLEWIGKFRRKERGTLQIFAKQVIDWRKKLLVNPLSEAQWGLLFKVERLLGIYYTDLSGAENGEIWQERITNGEVSDIE